ncbi:MAG: hypothetical protein IKU70_09965 [Clostridia bacterium]|nr:hypothetical protein [Clostridia bacterium]
MKRTLLLLLLAACSLLLSACYTEIDPWPEADLSSTPTNAPTATVAPATEAPLTAVPHPPQPTGTKEPLPEDAVDVSPNLNG